MNANLLCVSLNGIDLPCEVSSGKQIFARYPERAPSLGFLPGEIVFEYSGETFTSILISETVVQNKTQEVAFIGSKEGHLLKVQFNKSQLSGVLYERLDVLHPVLSDTWLGTDSIMVLTERKLLELSVANCSQHQTCSECIHGDPYCGWCTLMGSCTRSTECIGSDDGDRWLPFYESTCLDILLEPDFLSVTHAGAENITIHATHLPVGVNYACHFGNLITPAYRSSESLNRLACLTPNLSDIPDFSKGDNAVSVNFSLSSSEYDIKFITIPYYFFNCSRISGCKDCTSQWDCGWCATDFTCSFNGSCNQDSYITSECPTVIANDIYIPHSVYREITVTVQTPSASSAISTKTYECVVTYVDSEVVSLAVLSNISVKNFSLTCDVKEYNYEAKVQEIPAELRIKWRDNQVYLDGTIRVTLYKCEVDRPDCSRCLSNITTPPVLNCGWCSSQSKCAVSENCPQTIQQNCTDPPTITSIYPSSGPVEGGTIVQINGTNLGLRFSDIENVTLGGIVCEHTDSEPEYEIGESITCRAGESDVMEGDVSVTIMDRVSKGDITFSYRDPEITSVSPVQGPASGGTVITINGTDLNTGRNITALLGDEDCLITLIEANYLQCVNLNSAVNSYQTVTVVFDGHYRFLPLSLMYKYVEDPVINRVEPTKFIRAGGNTIIISGERLDIIRHPKLIFTLHDSHFQAEESCIPINPSEMICRAPSLAVSDVGNEIDKDGDPLDVGFVMDGVTDLLNWSINNDVIFKYFRDPEYHKSDVCVDDTSDHFFNLTGRFLNDGSTPDDVTVCLGNRECQLVTLMSTYLLCERQQAPSPVGFCNEKNINEESLVCVQHANLKFEIGTLRCSPQLTVVLTVVSACALVIAAIIFLVVYCKHKGKKQSAITQLEMEIARIENNYHEEMRRMFKNLNISALTTDGKVATLNIMPICSPAKYIEVLLYNDVHFLPSNTQSQTVSDTTLKQPLSSLSDLLGESELLEVLLHVLDNVHLEEKERINIVSHISVFLVLNEKHTLYTQILLQLSERRIENARGNELQNLFKSGNTSLQIFLCNWIALGFYDYFNDVRKPLQQCHEAIRCSVEAGPIDAVTGKSQFSINDQYLFNMQIEFDAVNLFVRFNKKAREDLVQLEFLSVDTISQVIGKILDHIYQERPYSSRPIPETFDLVWCRRDKPDRILRDDGILKLRNGWRKLNTLADYKIKSDDCIKLITKQDIESRNLDNMSETSSLISDLTKDDYIYPNGECSDIPHSHANGGENGGYLKPKQGDYSKISHSYASGVENDGYLQPKEGGGYEKVSHNYATGGENDDYLEPNKGEDYGKISHSYASVTENDGYLQPKEGGEQEEVLHSYATGKENNGSIEPIEREGEQQKVLHTYATGKENDGFIEPKEREDDEPEDIYDEPEGGLGQWIWHLEKIEDTQNDISGTIDQTVTQQQERLNEISVPYLSATTTAIQTYLNKMFTTFMTASNDQLPLSVKLIYDLFDKKASELGNPSLATMWKDDILPLGIWTDLLDKLHLIYDIKDCVYVKACIQVILQTLRDVCKRNERNISDDKPSSKGLYNELVPVYSSKLDLFYNDSKDLREVNYDAMQKESKRIEQTYQNSFDKSQVLFQLYLMIFKYRDQIYELLRRENERLKENLREQSTSIEHLIEVLETLGGNDGSNTSVEFT